MRAFAPGSVIGKVYHCLLFGFSIPRIDRMRLRSVISRGEPPSLFNHFGKSISRTSCSTATFVTRTLTGFSPCGMERSKSRMLRTIQHTSFRRLENLSQRKKNKRAGRPKRPKGAKGRIVPVRLASDELTPMIAAAVAAKQTLSEWISSTLSAATKK
jgi:hypothetical protein